VGVPAAAIGLWDGENGVHRYPTAHRVGFTHGPDELIAGRAFSQQRAIFVPDAVEADPSHAEIYRESNALAALCAPITAGERRLGVLSVYAVRAPIFASDDLALVRLLADQAAVILESRALIDEASRVQAREEATRLRDDFLSAAAHDLKTPLAALVMQVQLLERRARLRPDAPADLDGIRQVIKQTERLRAFVTDLLDAARVENQAMVRASEPSDLVAVIQTVRDRSNFRHHPIVIEANESLLCEFDRQRIEQLLDNLVGNAVKYSPNGGEIRIKAWQENGHANVTVTDQGIGIPASDLPHVFDRFHRAQNVDDRRFAGMGLGLYICRRIVEQHGGTISVSSEPGMGSTFHVVLPIHHDAEVAAP
jgi:signal transduction histidine kinase